MRTAIVGRGAIGILYAMQMKAHGAEPLFIVDKDRLERYEKEPVIVNGTPVQFQYAIKGEPADLVMIMTKASGLEDALEEIESFTGPDTIILSCLNGITSEDIVRQRYPENTVIRTIVQGMDTVFLNGRCEYSHIGEILIGPEKPEDVPAVEKLRAFFDRIKMPCRVCEDIVREQWNKLMLNCGVNQICATRDCGYGQAAGKYRDLFIRVMKEVQAVASARDIDLTDDDIDRWLQVCEELDPDSVPSMAQDVRAGRPTELILFSGTIVPMAEELGIPVPELTRLKEQIETYEAGLTASEKTDRRNM